VHPDVLIVSDEWAAYSDLSQGFFHLTVCHKYNFVNPITGVHTQRIESLWAACKRWLRIHEYRCSRRREQYVQEWCWRYNHGSDPYEIMRALLS